MRVETENGKTTLLGAGAAVVEVMQTLHRGRAVDGPAEILVFYAGSRQLPNTVIPEQQPDSAGLCDQAAS